MSIKNKSAMKVLWMNRKLILCKNIKKTLTSSIAAFDWEKCLLFQQTTGEPLQCPADMMQSDVDPGTGYHSVASNIQRFHELDALPMNISMSSIDDGCGIAETLMKHRRKWHRHCKDE